MKDNVCKTSRWRLLKAQLNNLEPKAFQKKMNESKGSIILDCRTPSEFEKGHIEGAINIDYSSENFWDEVEQLTKTVDIFVYCQIGRKSIRACTLMRNGGFDNLKINNLEGGYILWDKLMNKNK